MMAAQSSIITESPMLTDVSPWLSDRFRDSTSSMGAAWSGIGFSPYIAPDASGTSYIEFETTDDPFALTGRPYDDHHTPAARSIDLSQLLPFSEPGRRKILVTGCSKRSTEEGLRTVLERYGRIQHIQIWHDVLQQHTTGRNSMCAIVTYESDASTDALLHTWPHFRCT